MKIKNEDTVIFDRYHYKAKLLLGDKKFQEAIQRFRSLFSNVGCPIPNKGFTIIHEFRDWRKQLARHQIQQLKSNTIGNNHSLQWRDEIEKILKDFNLSQDFYMFVWAHIFRGINQFTRPLFDLIIQPTKEGNEVLIKYYHYTKHAHINAHKLLLQKAQANTKGYKGKNKPLTEFEKNIKVYNYYLELRQKTIQERKRIYNNPVRYPGIYEMVAQKYDTSSDNVRKVIKEFNLIAQTS